MYDIGEGRSNQTPADSGAASWPIPAGAADCDLISLDLRLGINKKLLDTQAIAN
jgi:hypothetical protein